MYLLFAFSADCVHKCQMIGADDRAVVDNPSFYIASSAIGVLDFARPYYRVCSSLTYFEILTCGCHACISHVQPTTQKIRPSEPA
jgi:hypothetical protein